MKFKKFILIFFVLIFSIFNMGCIIENNDNETNHNNGNNLESYLHFEIEIIPDKKVNYTVICPIPIISAFGNSEYENEGEPIKMLSELNFLKGHGNYSVQNSTYGYGINIISNESIILIVNNTTDWNGNDFSELSNLNFYFDSEYSSEIKINYLADNNVVNRRFCWKGNNIVLKKGWQEIELESIQVIID